ncbi:hypothetical protein LzC2_06940 [Planctomycetes bacterium LzC2]|uniref:Uncharacterized protein n=1 Tax=Alienimonas chondri TaxID=2681879 RepID=A0ABX1VAW6_9PLAN|nr:hypothetical protein [Alienimonas chondri]
MNRFLSPFVLPAARLVIRTAVALAAVGAVTRRPRRR